MSTAQFANSAAQFFYNDSRLVLRSFRESDQAAASELLYAGLLSGHIDPIDAVAELTETEQEYRLRSKDRFWVAELDQSVIGTIAVAVDRLGIAHVRRLRVAPAWQVDSRIAMSLVQMAAAHARDHDCQELIYYAPVNDVRPIEFLRHLGFRFGANRKVAGAPVLEFYNDLYSVPAATFTAPLEMWSRTERAEALR
jgi:N-acetylglutamate synthase-like GNAT family acetyltransferase